jgi:uncharacterized protein (DUF427 family)
VLYAEPLRRRMRAELGGRTVVQSDDAVVLFEPGRYPVAYFPIADFAEGALRRTERRTKHAELGETACNLGIDEAGALVAGGVS